MFYTDAQYWASLKSDEERNCDDWDVDMTVYYKDGNPDMDSVQMREMREQKEFERGTYNKSVFRKRATKTVIRNELALVKKRQLNAPPEPVKPNMKTPISLFVRGSSESSNNDKVVRNKNLKKQKRQRTCIQ